MNSGSSREYRYAYLGFGAEKLPFLGVLEAELLGIMWDLAKPMYGKEFYKELYRINAKEGRKTTSLAMIEQTLNRLVKKGYLGVNRNQEWNKNVFYSNRSRKMVVNAIKEDVMIRLGGQKIEDGE